MTHQTTLRNSVTCQGIGLHSGASVRLNLHPARENHGIVFRRLDVEGKTARIPARYDLVSDTRLGTTLKNRHGVSVSTVEHLMAALWGMGVDNALVELDGPEVPIMDGSSEPFIALIEEAGLRNLAAARKVIRILKPVEIAEGKSTARVDPLAGGMALDVEIDYDHHIVTRAHSLYDFRLTSFADVLAQARTFGFAHEVDYLRAHGLARGGSLENAVVVGENGIINAEGLRMPDEFIRHKALDCVGDLFLAGARIEGMFSFLRPGHGVNNKLLRALMADKTAWKLVSTEMPACSVVPAQEAVAVAWQ